MPNITWLEPQALIDLMAMNLFAAENGLNLSGLPEIAIVSPWLSDVEIELRPGPWHQQLSVGRSAGGLSLSACLKAFTRMGWLVEVAVLAFGASPSGLIKEVSKYPAEVR